MLLQWSTFLETNKMLFFDLRRKATYFRAREAFKLVAQFRRIPECFTAPKNVRNDDGHVANKKIPQGKEISGLKIRLLEDRHSTKEALKLPSWPSWVRFWVPTI